MNSIPVAVLEFVEGGRAIWVHNDQGQTVMRIRCTGKITVHRACENTCPHIDLNVIGNMEFCAPKSFSLAHGFSGVYI